jgi:ribosomal protein S18 acetylase RimI-like enzyme
MDQLVIRQLTQNDDQNKIINIWKNSLYEVQTNKQSTENYVRRQLEKDMKNIYQSYIGNHGMFFLAEINNVLVGFIGLLKKDDEYHVCRLNVIPEFRNKGIAKQLANKMKQHCQMVNLDNVYATVDKTNMPSMNLLFKYGFVYDELITDEIMKMKYKN